MSEKDHEHIFADIPKEAHDRAKRIGDALAYASGDAWGVARWYEDLIDEGKLRVAEEVEAIEHWSFIKCSGCGLSYPWEADALIGTINYCPGCGNKIKR